MNAFIEMSDNDFQNAQIQRTLLELTEKIGAMNTSIGNLHDGLKENSKRVQEEAKEMKATITEVKGQVDALNLKAKYWKFGVCFVLACGSVFASIISTGNEVFDLFKNLFGGK